ncbi:MAG: ester cyclase [Actinobacteria bacterium]|nr:ester cyclase [Actinomycetota bacterium]
MSSEANKDTARRYLEEVYGNGNLELVDELLDSGIQDHEDFGDQKPAGRTGIKELVKVFRTAFPDIRVSIEDMVAEGEKVFMRCRWEGTHQNEFAGIEATGKHIYFDSMDEIRFNDGVIQEHWGVTDTMGLLAQLGGIEPHVEYPGGSSLYLDG